MDHKAFLSSLTPDQRAALLELSDARGLWHLAGHLGAIGLCTTLIATGAPLWQAVMVLHGILLVFLFTLLHETSHHTPFKTRWLNTAIGHLCGFVLFLPALWFRYFHLAHHRYTQIPGKDPELAEPKPETWAAYLRHISGIPVWIGHGKTLIRNAIGHQRQDFVPDARRADIRIEARLYLLGYGLLAGLSLWQQTALPVFVWLIPLLLGQPFLRLYLLAEHGRCAFVANMFENSRTTFTNRLVRALAWNMPYHAEHHSYPAVPFHNLPRLHALTKPHLAVTAKGYGAFNKDYISGFQGKPGTANPAP